MVELTEINPCKTWEEEMYWKHFHAMHFYQVLPKDFLHHLALPSKFGEYMANKLPNIVSLIGPSSATWDVELSKTGTCLDLVGDGWNDFAKTYNLEENSLIVFKYKQNSSFEVLIFDQNNSCEKESSYFVKKCLPKPEYRADRKRCVSEAASTEIMEDDDGDSDCVLSKKAKKGTAEASSTCPSDEFSEDSHNDPEFVESDKAIDDIIVEIMSSGGRKKHQRLKTRVSNEAAAKDGGAPSNTPKSKIKSVKKPGDGNNTTRMLNELEEMEVIAPKDKTMNGDGPPEANNSRKPGIKRGRPAKKSTPKRSKKLALKGGDSGSKRLSTREYISHRRPVTSDEKDDAFRQANEASTKGDFIVVMHPTAVYKRFYLSFPSEWIHKNMGKQHQEVILRAGEKTWVTMFHSNTNRGNNSGGLASGWKNFAIENNLEDFDVCLFKPASNKEDPTFTLDVEIFRVVKEITPLTPHASSI